MLAIILNTCGFVLSFFLGSLLVTNVNTKSTTEKYAGYLLIVFSILILNSLRILILGPYSYKLFEIISNYSLFLVGPLLYLSVDKKTIHNKKAIKYGVFLPFFLILLLRLSGSILFSEDILFKFDGLLFYVMLSILTYFQFLAIKKVNKKDQKTEKWIKLTLYGFVLIWHANLLLQIVQLFTPSFNEKLQIFATLGLSILSVAITYSYWSTLIKKLNPVRSELKLSTAKSKEILDSINDALSRDKSYLRSDFNMQKFSKQINVPSSYISAVVNNHFKMSFPKYIGKLRIEAFVKLAQTNTSYSIDGLSKEVGFNSSSTFNSAFKENMKMLPSEYIKTIKTLN